MKKIFGATGLMMILAGLFAFTVIESTEEPTFLNHEVGVDLSDINLEESYVQYTGYKNVGKKHWGKLSFANGSFEVEEGKLTGGEFVIDMNSMTSDDLKGIMAKKLIKHLKSSDFFETETFPTSKFVITDITKDSENGFSHILIGDMTIKGVTKNIEIPANVNVDGDIVTIDGKAKIDRTEFGVKYGSGNYFKDLAANRVIKDKFLLEISLISK